MQILSAMADDYTVHIYLEIQDLTGERPMKHILDLLTDSFVPNVDNEIQIRWGERNFWAIMRRLTPRWWMCILRERTTVPPGLESPYWRDQLLF